MSLKMDESKTAADSSQPEQSPEERVAERMAYGIFENAHAYLAGDRDEFKRATLITTEPIHARAAEKLAFLLDETSFGKDARQLTSVCDEEWAPSDIAVPSHDVVKLSEIVAVNGSRQLHVESTFKSHNNHPHILADLVQVVYTGYEVSSAAEA